MKEFKTSIQISKLGIHPQNSPQENSKNVIIAQLCIPFKEGQTWIFEKGEYHFSEPFSVIRRLCLKGACGGWSQPGTKLVFPEGMSGLIFESNYINTRTGVIHAESAGASADSLWIHSKGKGGAVGHGLMLKRPVHLTKLLIDNFRGDGIRIHAQVPESNANSFIIEKTHVTNCGEEIEVNSVRFLELNEDLGVFEIETVRNHNFSVDDEIILHSPYWLYHQFPQPYDPERLGKPHIFHCGIYRVRNIRDRNSITAEFIETNFTEEKLDYLFYQRYVESEESYSIVTGNGIFTRRGDANAGCVSGCIFINNAGYGILENGFLGNTYQGCTTEKNGMGAVRSIKLSAHNVFTGTYAESDQPISALASNTIFLGGKHAPLIKRLLSNQHRYVPISEVEKLSIMGRRIIDYPRCPSNVQEDSPLTWEAGDRVHVFGETDLLGENKEGWICIKSGTFDRGRNINLPVVDSNGSRVIIANQVGQYVYPDYGEWLEINSEIVRVEKRVMIGNKLHLVVSKPIPHDDRITLTYSHPVFNTLGRIP